MSGHESNELALSYREAVTRGILQAVPGGVVHVDRTGAVITANAEALRVLGLSYDALTQRYTFQFEPITVWEDGSPCPASQYPVSRALATGEPQPATTIGVRKPNGEISWAVFRAIPLKDERTGEVTGAIVTFLDITERKAAEAERAALEEQLRHAQRLDSIGQLAGGIAHDFNNLLQIILGNTELVDGSNVAAQLQDIRNAAERAAELTEGLLAFARRQPLPRRQVSLQELVGAARRLLEPLTGEGIHLEYALERAAGVIHADRHAIEQALVNLCINARDAMRGAGTIVISSDRVVPDAAFIRQHPWATEQPYLVIRVRDDGPGIPLDQQARIFEPFFTTKPAGAGTGLGLSIVYGAMQNHGGAITVESAPGRGATFSLYFPEVRAQQQPLAVAAPARRLAGKERILVVEDEETIRRLVVRVLSAKGYDVLSAASGRAALELVRAHRGTLDLLFVDVVMPGMRGPELVRQAREIQSDLRVLFTTGYELKPADGESRGRDPVLYKPYTPDELLPRLRELLERPAS